MQKTKLFFILGLACLSFMNVSFSRDIDTGQKSTVSAALKEQLEREVDFSSLDNAENKEKTLAALLKQVGYEKNQIGKIVLVEVGREQESAINSERELNIYIWWYDGWSSWGIGSPVDIQVKSKHSKLSFYSTNISSLLSHFKQHENFFKGHEILNCYQNLPTEEKKMISWIYAKSQANDQYPLLTHQNNVSRAAEFIKNLHSSDFSAYPEMSQDLVECKDRIEKTVAVLYASHKLQEEHDKKADNRRKDEEVQIQKDLVFVQRQSAYAAGVQAEASLTEAKARLDQARADAAKNSNALKEKKDLERHNALLLEQNDLYKKQIEAQFARLSSEINELHHARKQSEPSAPPVSLMTSDEPL